MRSLSMGPCRWDPGRGVGGNEGGAIAAIRANINAAKAKQCLAGVDGVGHEEGLVPKHARSQTANSVTIMGG